MDGNCDRFTVVLVAQAALSGGARSRRGADLRNSWNRIQHQLESSTPRDTFRQVESADSEKNKHRSVYRCQCSYGACRRRPCAADAADGIPGAVKAREHLSRCFAAPRQPEDRTAAYVVQSDRCVNRAALIKRSESSEHPNPARVGSRYPARLYSAYRLATPRGGLFTNRAPSSRPSFAGPCVC